MVLFSIHNGAFDQNFLVARDLRKVELLGALWHRTGFSLGLLEQQALDVLVGEQDLGG